MQCLDCKFTYLPMIFWLIFKCPDRVGCALMIFTRIFILFAWNDWIIFTVINDLNAEAESQALNFIVGLLKLRIIEINQNINVVLKFW